MELTDTCRKTISLAGNWTCTLGGDQSIDRPAHSVRLPGTTQTNGIGPVPPKQLISSLTPTTEYIGPARYQRDIELTAEDCRRSIELYLERCGWVSAAWLNGVALGSRDSLVSPHVYDLSGAGRPGTNRLTILMDNSNTTSAAAPPTADGSEGEDLVVEADTRKRLNCGGHHALFGGPCWNGITGRIELQVREMIRVVDLQVHPDLAGAKVRVVTTYRNDSGRLGDGSAPRPGSARLGFTVRDLQSGAVCIEAYFALACEAGTKTVERELSFPAKPKLWDEFDPNLYELSATLETDRGTDTERTTFGMRELSREGTQIAINGRPTFLRGALENFVHPFTGYPPTDIESWLEIFRVNLDHGLNHVRFHTCCPPDAAFAAADRLGIMLNVELPGCSGYEPEDAQTLNYLEDEAVRILTQYGNHPSFCMLTMGNELLYDSETRTASQAVLMRRVALCRDLDDRHWYCCTAHPHTEGRDDDFYVSAWPKGATWEEDGEPITGIRWSGFDVVNSSRFNTRPPETASDYRSGIAGIDRPVITHEVGQWAVYPDVREADEFTGVQRANNQEIIRDFMAERGTLARADDFVRASASLSLLLYKEEIESALRTPGLSGFQLLGFHDHPPQGTSTVGIVTALRRPKGVVRPEEFRRFCSPTVPLARLPKRTFTSEEVFSADVDFAHYGRFGVEDGVFGWSLATDGGDTIAEGCFEPQSIPTGGLTRLGRVEVPLSSVSAATKAMLTVTAAGTEVANSWDVWIYPPPVTGGAAAAAQAAAAVTQTVGGRGGSRRVWHRGRGAGLATVLAEGGAAVLELPAEEIPGAIPGCFTTVFWNPIMKRNQKAFTMGVLCDPEHPALAEFPTEMHSNWQWWDVLGPSRVLDLECLDPRPEGLVMMIDSFIGNRPLAVVFEARVGAGRLLVTSLDLSSDLETRHAARQLRRSLEAYVASSAFNPQIEISADDIDRLIAAHQQVPKQLSRDEVKALFDRPMHRGALSAANGTKTQEDGRAQDES